VQWLGSRVPYETPRSACSFCPYHDTEEWRRVKSCASDWDRACLVDDWLRSPGYMEAHSYNNEQFLHRSCVPLRDVDLSAPPSTAEFSFVRECEGMCGV